MSLRSAGTACILASMMAALAACTPDGDAPLASGPPGSEERLAEAAFVALSRNASADAEQIAIEAVRRYPDDPYALLALAMAYEARGKKDLAREQYRIITTMGRTTTVVLGPGGPRLVGDVARDGLLRLAPPPVGPGTEPGPEHAERRFVILRELVDRGLVTQDEWLKRRTANLGVLLPYSETPPAAALDWPPPSTEQFADRLQAIGRSLEARALTPREHALERMAILEALLPTTPQARRPAPLAPTAPEAAAAEMARLQRLRGQGLISNDEYLRERAAIERMTPTALAQAAAGSAPQPLMSGERRPMPAPAAPVKPAVPADAMGVHLASHKSEAAAQQSWEQLRKRYPDLLGKLDAVFPRAEVKGKGTFWRVIAGPLPDKKAAQALCGKLKAQKQFCADIAFRP